MKTAARILVIAAIGGLAFYINQSGLFRNLLERIESLGVWAPFAFLVLYVLTCVFFVPSFIFTFAAGAVFGLWKGILYSLIGAGLGALSAFLIGRYLARAWAARYFEARPEFRRMDEAVKRKGWKIILLARLSPVFPFLVGNYAFGLTRMPALHYFFASVLGTIPSTAVYVYAGTVAGTLGAGAGRGRTGAEWALLIGGLLATVVLTWYIRRAAREALDKNLETPAAEGPG